MATSSSEAEEQRLLRERIDILERQIDLKQNLPHLYGWKWYGWAREYFESVNKDNFLCAANQISKSTTNIRKCIHWATNRALWPKLWMSRPLQFWYLYPTKDVADVEFQKKWIKQILPKGKYKQHPDYGWKEEYKHRELQAVHFNTEVSVYFKTYAQEAAHLQTGTVDAIFRDEELPVDIWDELNFRRSATDGYFHMVFTATLGQEFWRETMEEHGDAERFKGAFKRQVSLYDCLEYEDGTNTHWTRQRIEIMKARCRSEAEIQRRVYGRFVVDGNRKYESFEPHRNVKPGHPLPKDWIVYAGVDIGSGGGEGHPAAIVFVAVSPDFKQGRVFRGWRGDNELTDSSDILEKFRQLRGNLRCAGQFYDWHGKDFQTIATRLGEPFMKAEKGHDIGEGILNVLFKNGMLVIYDYPELRPLVHELSSLKRSTAKSHAKDDYTDALRYAVTRIPWDWSAVEGPGAEFARQVPSPYEPTELDERRRGFGQGEQQSLEEQEAVMGIDDEIASWDELYDT